MCRYWQVIQRSVLLGWTDNARDLLYSHSEGQAVEEELSRHDQVTTGLSPTLFRESLLHWLDMSLT